MRQEAYVLVEAVRALGLEIGDAPPPKCLRISIDPEDFWLRLVDVRRALEAFDRAGGTSEDVDGPAPDDKMKRALNALLRLYEAQGGDTEQAAFVIREALQVAPAKDSKTKRKKAYVTLPMFAPQRLSKQQKYTLRISLLPKTPSRVDLDDLRRESFDVNYVEVISGNTMPSEPAVPRQRLRAPSF